MDERLEFVARRLTGESMAQLCCKILLAHQLRVKLRVIFFAYRNQFATKFDWAIG